jgi:cell division protein FtsW
MVFSRRDASFWGNQAVLIAVLLAIGGTIVILSATSISARAEQLSSYVYFRKQAFHVLLGIGVMWLASRVDYHRMRFVSFFALLGCVAMLVLCLLPNTRTLVPLIGGARRWIHLGPFSFQPSELAKFFLVCWTAGYLVRKRATIGEFSKGFVPYLLIAGAFFLLVVKEPDLSMAAMILLLMVLIGYIGGLRTAHLLILGLCLVPFVTYKFVYGVGYRSNRLNSFLLGEADKAGSGYQAFQSKLALGSGGLTGVGLGNSKQKYFFLPAAHTDFIFSIVGEEMGFAGSLVVVAAFSYLAWLGIKIARAAPDYYGFLLASGLALMIFFSALLNLSVASGLAPTTGMPLPLLSYGGSSLITTFWAVGILNNISRSAERSQNDEV